LVSQPHAPRMLAQRRRRVDQAQEIVEARVGADLSRALVAQQRAQRPMMPSHSTATACCPSALRSRQVRTDPRFPDFLHLIDTTPALREHARRMWLRHENALAAAIVADTGLPEGDPAAQALAHFALEAVSLVHGRDDSERALDRIFTLLDAGWTATARESMRRDSD
ncbi:hypothetical protein, partial [Nocardia brasiliensis]|uniref:hypothetical protein n=1 Tax=Nocardia brasiliensis TaxID=37326 RepID=UPI002454C809